VIIDNDKVVGIVTRLDLYAAIIESRRALGGP
jgi:CBS domain-containing protein